MPEGDTIFRTARTLHAALAGKRVARVEARGLRPGDAPRPGTPITAVEAHGKHVLVRFGDGTALRTHLRMTGSWHVYRAGEHWRKPPHLQRALVEADDGMLAVCFAAPDVQLLRGDAAVATRLEHLGPDLCRADADLDEAASRLGRVPAGTELGVALLDQHVAAGIGNVFKSEICFARRIDPFTPVDALDAQTRRAVIETAAKLLRANLDRAGRRTWDGGLAVYGRAGRPCPRCGTPVQRRRQGEQARTTYWCPRCQPPVPTPSRQVGSGPT